VGEERQQFVETGKDIRAEGIPSAKQPFTVGFDGAWVHAVRRPERKEAWFEIIVGKSDATGEGKYLAFVHNYDQKPKRRLYEILKSHGLESDQPVRFLSDGGDTVRRLQMHLNPQSEHVLDWFHVTMRLTVMEQMRKGMQGLESSALVHEVETDLET
jgi:hypothetical protein